MEQNSCQVRQAPLHSFKALAPLGPLFSLSRSARPTGHASIGVCRPFPQASPAVPRQPLQAPQAPQVTTVPNPSSWPCMPFWPRQ